MSSNSDRVRKSTLATLDEIRAGETALKAQGIDVRDPSEWMQLKDIVARIERKLMAKIQEPAE